MPAVTQQQPDQTTIHSLNKKRRRDDDDAATPRPSTSSYEAYTLRPLSWASSHNNNHHLHIAPEHHQIHNLFAHAPHHHHQHRPVRSLASPAPKRLKECSPFSITNQQQQLKSPPPEPTTHRPPQPARQDSSSSSAQQQQQLLARCHICGRKPARKSDLDSFASCEGCGQRTCFVCLRECGDWRTEEERRRWDGYLHRNSTSFTMGDVADDQTEEEMVRLKKQLGVLAGMEEGSIQNAEETRHTAEGRDMDDGQHEEKDGWAAGGHRQRICSRCCVERGPDGDVVCLGCLPFVEG